jgi:TPR repeat protein
MKSLLRMLRVVSRRPPAARAGHPANLYAPAQHALGLLYEIGRDVPFDEAEAIRLYRLAAGQG